MDHPGLAGSGPGTTPRTPGGRLGAFVDGVYAIAATLLVIELRPPEDGPPGELGSALLHLGPQYWAYAIGFVQMVAGWLQSRRLDAWMRGVDHYATLLVLVSVGLYALTPFSTVVLAQALRSGDGHDLGTAVRLMALLLFIALIAFAGLLLYSRSTGLLRADVDPEALSLYLRTAVLVVPLVPVVAFALSYGSPWLGLALIVLLNLLGLLPLESHRAPDGVDRGPRPAGGADRDDRDQQHQVADRGGGVPVRLVRVAGQRDQLQHPEDRVRDRAGAEAVQVPLGQAEHRGHPEGDEPGRDHPGGERGQRPRPQRPRGPGRGHEQGGADGQHHEPLHREGGGQPGRQRVAPGRLGAGGPLLSDRGHDQRHRDHDVHGQPEPGREPGHHAVGLEVELVQVQQGGDQGEGGEHGHHQHRDPGLRPLPGPQPEERQVVRDAVARLRLTPVMFELGARPHPPRELYRAYLAQSDAFVAIYWRRYGWVAPGEAVSGLEDEYLLSGDRPKLIYVKAAEDREPRLSALLQRVQADDRAAYKPFRAAAELADLLADDLAVLLTERFTAAVPAVADPPELRAARLPVPPTGLLGRSAEVAAVTALLREARLVTLVGPGGIGKTRLALEVARSADPDRVAFVDLAPVADPAQVPGAVAAALGIRPEGTGPVLDLLVDRLRDRDLLLVPDNVEQVLPAAADVAALLAGCPRLRVLVTSRTALRLRGEREVPLAPLATPDAVALLVERGTEVRPGFDPDPAALAELARRLDGIPMALELAAARLRLLSPAQLLARLGDRLDRPLDLAAGPVDLPDRQRTLRATIEWSYGLLSPAERLLLDRLSVFAAAFTLAGAEEVGAGPDDVLDTLSSLVAQSMVGPVEDDDAAGEPRFRMLGTVRAYARERLAQRGDRAATLARVTRWLRECVAEAGPGLSGPDNRVWGAGWTGSWTTCAR